MGLHDLTRVLAQKLDLDPSGVREDGGLELIVDDEYLVEIAADPAGRGFSLSATVGPIPGDNTVPIYRELLMANLLGQGTGGASLGIDDLVDEVVLSRSYSRCDCGFDAFESDLACFIEALVFWRKRQASGQIGNGKASEDAAAADPGGGDWDAPGIAVRV